MNYLQSAGLLKVFSFQHAAYRCFRSHAPRTGTQRNKHITGIVSAQPLHTQQAMQVTGIIGPFLDRWGGQASEHESEP